MHQGPSVFGIEGLKKSIDISAAVSLIQRFHGMASKATRNDSHVNAASGGSRAETTHLQLSTNTTNVTAQQF